MSKLVFNIGMVLGTILIVLGGSMILGAFITVGTTSNDFINFLALWGAISGMIGITIISFIVDAENEELFIEGTDE